MSAQFYLLYIDELDKSILSEIITKLPSKSQEKILRYRSLADRWQFTLSNLLLRSVLKQELKIPDASIKIEIDRYGKPFLIGGKRHFNLSYSKDIVVLATDCFPIGIDVEYVQPLDNLDDLILSFSKNEQRAYKLRSQKKRTNYFYDLWTTKESYLKAIGKGLHYRLDSFNIVINDKEIYLVNKIGLRDLRWTFKRYALRKKYKCVVCAREGKLPEKPTIIKTKSLINSSY
jgi:4'-phosphopantetheinyl transferase